MHRNALSKETSPYLLQHAQNPVEWYPWGAQALELAQHQYKPILLSIGYSACHWCHVMAHESFEDEETAALMNELFINIKVDREERPDLDRIYQSAHQLLTQRAGGWPLTLFLDPDDRTPFFAGTYFPKNRSHGMPAFKDLLRGVVEQYRVHRGDIQQQGASLIQALVNMDAVSSAGQAVIDQTPMDRARDQLQGSFDEIHGGFGSAPKFPHSTQIEHLLRRYAQAATRGEADSTAWRIVDHTLSKMALGGIFDQLGGGFCRYSVDDRWMIPHFEKMLYDNGPLLSLYSEAWQIGQDNLFQRVARETAEWVCREMQSPEGGYYSSLDADSEGEEGKYYTWSREEVSSQLSKEEYELFARCFGLDRSANFEGKWHLYAHQTMDELAEASDHTPERVECLLESARTKLLARREARVRPGRDEKILTSWNALMIKGMATAGRIFENPDWVSSAGQALDFIQTTLWRNGRLLATYKDGKAHLAAYLDDYAYLMDALLALLMARWRDRDLRFLIQLADVLLDAFEDGDQGGFYFTAHDHEALIHRPKPLVDEAMPAGNGIAAYALLRLGHLLGEQRYLDAAERTIAAAWPSLEQLPYAHGSLLNALEAYLNPPQAVVLRGDDELKPWLDQCNASYRPHLLTLAIPTDAGDLPGLLAQRAPAEGPIAYLCEGFQCGLPIMNLSDFESSLGKQGNPN